MSACKALAVAAAALWIFALPVVAVVLRSSPVPGNPANSTTIDGPDCGNVKKIFPQWEKAAQVGQVSGKAQGVINAAQAIAGGLDAAAAKVREAGKAIGKDGKPPAAIEAAAVKADEASAAVTTAVTALETKLSTFKTAVSGSKMSGADVTGAQVTEVKDLTTEVEVAARAAQEEVTLLTKKADEVQANALKDSATAVRLVQSVLDSVTPLLKEAPEIAQKAKWGVDKAKAAVTAATKVAADVDPTKAGDQEPVVTAAKDDLASQSTAVADAHPKVTTAIGELDTAVAALKTKVKPLKEAKQAAAGGGTVSTGIGKDLTAAETAEGDVRVALAKLRGTGGTLMARKDRLESAMKAVEKFKEKK